MEILNASVLLANYVLVPAIAYGSQLGLAALGVTLIYGILRFSNFAHGDTMSFGAMATILLTWVLQAAGVSIYPLPTAFLAIPMAAVITVIMVLGVDRVVYRPLRMANATPVMLVIASIGVMFVLQGVVRFVLGPGDRNFYDGARFVLRARDFRETFDLAEGLSIRVSQGITLAVTAILVVLLFTFLYRTRSGKAMRAYSDNEDLARLSGIDPEKVVILAWTLAAMLATVAGALYGLDKSFRPLVYFSLLLPTFAAAIVGGLGNPLGAFIGGFVVAFSEISLTYAFKRFVGYLLPEELETGSLLQLLSTDYKFAVSFLILVLVLLVRPTGIFAGKSV